MKFLVIYGYYCFIISCLFLIILWIYYRLNTMKLIYMIEKYKQYKRICKKLDNDIDIWVNSMTWDLARNTHHRLLRVRRIWKGYR